MKRRNLKAWLMAGIASIGWRLFIWGNQTTEEIYWKEVWEQENRVRAGSFPTQPEESHLWGIANEQKCIDKWEQLNSAGSPSPYTDEATVNRDQMFCTIDGMKPEPDQLLFFTKIGSDGLFEPVNSTYSHGAIMNRQTFHVFACETNAIRYREGKNRRIVKQRNFK